MPYAFVIELYYRHCILNSAYKETVKRLDRILIDLSKSMPSADLFNFIFFKVGILHTLLYFAFVHLDAA